MRHPHSPEFEYNYIDDGIFLGTNMCCQKHFDRRLIDDEGIMADISLEGEKINSPYGVDYYVWMPVVDKTAPTLAQLDFGVNALKKLVSMGEKVYVHCMFGHGRSPTLVAAYFIAKGMTPIEAIDFVRSKRPTIHLEDVQIGILEKYAAKVK